MSSDGVKANRGEPKSYLGLVIHFKLVSFSIMKEVHGANYAHG